MSKVIVKHRHGLVADCQYLPMVPIVPQSAPMVSVADVSVKLYPQAECLDQPHDVASLDGCRDPPLTLLKIIDRS